MAIGMVLVTVVCLLACDSAIASQSKNSLVTGLVLVRDNYATLHD